MIINHKIMKIANCSLYHNIYTPRKTCERAAYGPLCSYYNIVIIATVPAIAYCIIDGRGNPF